MFVFNSALFTVQTLLLVVDMSFSELILSAAFLYNVTFEYFTLMYTVCCYLMVFDIRLQSFL